MVLVDDWTDGPNGRIPGLGLFDYGRVNVGLQCSDFFCFMIVGNN